MIKAIENEVYKLMSSMKVHLPGQNISASSSNVWQKCSGLRKKLLEDEKQCKIKSLMGNSYWDVTPKYRLDVLLFDIPKIADQIAYSIGFSLLHVEDAVDGKGPYEVDFSHHCYWYHVDIGIRLVSSGWDRLSLLFDLAFNLELNVYCNIRKALKELKKAIPEIINNEFYRKLTSFRDSLLSELDGKKGKGKRHETTHIFSPSTRDFMEYLEKVSEKTKRERDPMALFPIQHNPKDKIEWLKKHYDEYLKGVENTLELIEEFLPPTFSYDIM